MKKFKKISDFSEVALDAARILGGYGQNGSGGGIRTRFQDLSGARNSGGGGVSDPIIDTILD